MEYVICGLGFIKALKDIEKSVVKVNDNVLIYVENVVNVVFGLVLCCGILDKGGVEVVGGVVIVCYGENLMVVIKNTTITITNISSKNAISNIPNISYIKPLQS